MIDVVTIPRNHKHFRKLMAFAHDVLGVCDDLGIEPILTSSLAVFAYTQDPALDVHDVDLSCSESWFPRLRQALEARGIVCRMTDWHVLQARRDDLKVEFDATEHWMQGIPDNVESVTVGGIQFRMVSIDGLRELYQRGLADTSGKVDASSVAKHQAIAEKLRSLEALRS